MTKNTRTQTKPATPQKRGGRQADPDDADRAEAVAEFLYEGLQAFEAKQKRRVKLGEYADWLGIDQASYSLWANKKRLPSRANCAKIAEKLGPEIFDIMGFARPDKALQRVVSSWNQLTEEEQADILKIIGEKGETERPTVRAVD